MDAQRLAATAVERTDRLPQVIHTVAGIDVSYGARGRAAHARGAAVLLDAETLAVLEQAAVELDTTFPYVPGLLTFREAPVAIAALDALSVRPDLIVCDGQGIAHPRRCGVASHLGLALDLPAIGAAKSRLIGHCDEPPPARGAWTPLMDGGEVIGACLRTRERTAPIWVSTGHRVARDRHPPDSPLRAAIPPPRAHPTGRPPVESPQVGPVALSSSNIRSSGIA
jgi:deoxyribonuclease V